jgi:hypothetical protein
MSSVIGDLRAVAGEPGAIVCKNVRAVAICLLLLDSELRHAPVALAVPLAGFPSLYPVAYYGWAGEPWM